MGAQKNSFTETVLFSTDSIFIITLYLHACMKEQSDLGLHYLGDNCNHNFHLGT